MKYLEFSKKAEIWILVLFKLGAASILIWKWKILIFWWYFQSHIFQKYIFQNILSLKNWKNFVAFLRFCPMWHRFCFAFPPNILFFTNFESYNMEPVVKMTPFCKNFCIAEKFSKKCNLKGFDFQWNIFLRIQTFQNKIVFKDWKPCYLLYFKKQPTM